MTRIALALEYDGSSFHGWQRQRSLISVQESLETALSKVADDTISTVCAGRTDKGVHAALQVVHFDTQSNRKKEAWALGANTFLPASIRALWAKEVQGGF